MKKIKSLKMVHRIILMLLKITQVYCEMNAEIVMDLLTPLKHLGESCGYSSCPVPQPGVLNVHIVPHTHGELGQSQSFYSYYTGDDDLFASTTQNMKRILDYTISELWANNNRKFTFSDMPYFFYWWSKRDETVRRMVYELLRQGRLFFVGGSWSMSDESTTSYHAIIDQFTYSLRKLNVSFMECGRPLVAWQADAVGHSREFASLMAQMGYDGLFLAPAGYDEEVARIQRREMEFLWRGSDDLGAESDIFSHILFDGVNPPPGFCFSSLCEDPLLITSAMTFNNFIPRVKAFIESMHYRQAPYYSSNNVMVAMGGRLAYFDASMWFANIDKLIKTTNTYSMAKNLSIYTFYSTPACYLKAVYDQSPTLKTKQDDFYPQAIDSTAYATGAYTSRPWLKYIARESHRYLQMAKQLHLTANLWGYDQFFEDYHWIYGVFQDHHVITGELWPRNMAFYIKRMYIMIQRSTLLFQDAFNKLRGSPTTTKYYRCQFNASDCINTSGPTVFIVVYNPLAWPVTIPVRLPIRTGREYNVYNPQMVRMKASTMPVPTLVKKLPGRKCTLETELVFMAEDLPPLGFRSYYYQRREHGWERAKRSLIKKINHKKPKKYLVRQNNNPPNDVIFEPDYEYFDDVPPATNYTTNSSNLDTKIEFGNVDSNENEGKYSNVLTPRTKIEATTDTTIAEQETTTSTYNSNTVGDEKENNEKDANGNEKDKNDNDTNGNETTKNYNGNENNKNDNGNNLVANENESTWNESSTTRNENGTLNEETATSGNTIESETTVSETSTITDGTERSVVTATPDFNPYIRRSKIRHTTVKSTTITTHPTRTTALPPRTPPQIFPALESADEKDPEDIEEEIYWRGYEYKNTVLDNHIRSKYIRVNLDDSRRISNISIANGIKIPFHIEMFYYVSDDPARLGKDGVAPPGAYVFRSMDNKQEKIQESVETIVYKSRLVQEIHCTLSPYASFVMRLYRESTVLEVEWLVGPIPVEDGLGKDMFIKYVTDLRNEGVFYTDSNGRQTLKRIRNKRASYEPTNKDPVAGNIYPVTSKIYMEDLNRNIRFSVLNDRSQGGSSLKDGEIALMLHRRLLTEDPIKENMNDTEFDKGVVVRGTHYIYISKADDKPTKIFEKKLAKEIELRPQILVSSPTSYGINSKNIWKSHKNEFSFLKKKLPVGVHVLTLDKWDANTILLRLENYLERKDAVLSGVKTVFLNDLFVNTRIKFKSVKEMTLAANIPLKDWTPLNWKNEKFFKNFNDAYGTADSEFADDKIESLEEVDLNTGIVLKPQRIRTFLLTY